MGKEGGGAPQLQGRGTRFRYDDGSETGASWRAAIDTQIDIPINHPAFRFRFCCSNESGSETGVSNQLWYSYDDAEYAATSTGSFYLRLAPSAFLSDGDHTSDLAGTADDLWDGAFSDTTNSAVATTNFLSGPWDMGSGPAQRMEVEYMIDIQEDNVVAGVDIKLKGHGGGGAVYPVGYDYIAQFNLLPWAADPVGAFIHRNRAQLQGISTR